MVLDLVCTDVFLPHWTKSHSDIGDWKSTLLTKTFSQKKTENLSVLRYQKLFLIISHESGMLLLGLAPEIQDPNGH